MNGRNVVTLPTATCPICGYRVRPKDITVRDAGTVFHAACFPYRQDKPPLRDDTVPY